MIAVILAAVAIAGIWLLSGPSEAWSELIVKMATSGAIIVAFPLVYAWHFVRGPAAMEGDAAAAHASEVGRLTGELEGLVREKDRTKAMQQKVLALSLQQERGTDFLSKRIAADQIGDWLEHLDDWERTTTMLLANEFSHQDAAAFQVASFQGRLTFTHQVGDEHNERLRELKARTSVLDEILKRYKDYWVPVTPEERDRVNDRIKMYSAHAKAERKEKHEGKGSDNSPASA